MKTACFVPEPVVYDGLAAELKLVLLRVSEPTVERSGNAICSALDSKAFAIVLVWLDPAAAPRREAMLVIEKARLVGIRSIVMGATLDRELWQQLERFGVSAYVSAVSERWQDELLKAIAAQQTGAEQSGLVCYNMQLKLTLDVFADAVRLSATGSYLDSIPQPGAHWAKTVLGHMQACASKAGGELLRELNLAGSYMGDLLFTEQVNRFYRQACSFGQSEPITLRVRVSDSLRQLPIEAAVPPGDTLPLCLRHPMVRHAPVSSRTAKWRPPKPANVLLIASGAYGRYECPRKDAVAAADRCPEGALDRLEGVDEEVRQIGDFLAQLKDADSESIGTILPLSSKEADRDAVKTALEQGPWDIVHFAGHGASCRHLNQEDGCLFLCADKPRMLRKPAVAPVIRDFWTAALATGSPNALVYLSCCKGVQSGLLYSLAANKPCEVIGFQHTVPDSGAKTLALEFYKALLGEHARDVSSALHLARTRVLSEGAEHEVAARLAMVCMGQ